MSEITFNAPFGGANQHVTDPRKHHGYHWIVASGVDMGSDAYYIEAQCQKAKDADAPLDTVDIEDNGTCITVTEYRNQRRIDRLREYVVVLEEYEEALKSRRKRVIDITPKVDQRYPLGMLSHTIGLYEITDKNWGEFFVRMRLYEELSGGAFLMDRDSKEKVPITPELARQHVGFKPMDQILTREQWWLRLLKNRSRELEYAAENDGAPEFPRPDEDDEH